MKRRSLVRISISLLCGYVKKKKKNWSLERHLRKITARRLMNRPGVSAYNVIATLIYATLDAKTHFDKAIRGRQISILLSFITL
jgi:hypothetical protein